MEVGGIWPVTVQRDVSTERSQLISGGMVTKTLIDIDEAALNDARRVLRTTTKNDTVNGALAVVAALSARRRDLERFAADARYLADKIAMARLHPSAVRSALAPLIEAGLVATCAVIEFEVLWSTRSPEEFTNVRHDRGDHGSANSRGSRTRHAARRRQRRAGLIKIVNEAVARTDQARRIFFGWEDTLSPAHRGKAETNV
ncbi:MAG: hypothetical protein F2789_11305 [Actinobacteria bacterium]|nr:hypothetical protein [Actinomycetota bacterium]